MLSTVTILDVLPPHHIDATASMRQELRQQLVESGASLYGVSSCASTQKQLADLGTTDHFTQGLDYVDCEVEAAFCRQMNVTVYPTWQINGQLYPEYYSLEKLSEKLSGDDEVDGLDRTSKSTTTSGGHDSSSHDLTLHLLVQPPVTELERELVGCPITHGVGWGFTWALVRTA